MAPEPPAGIRVGYILNTYPVPSGTFIRGEIEALEAAGVDVARFAVRRFEGTLVDPADQREAAATRYLLAGNTGGLVRAALREVLTNPVRLAATLPCWWRLYLTAGEGVVRHAAYLMEAAALRQETQARGIGHLHSHFSGNAPAVAMLAHLLGGPTFSFTAHGPDEFVEAPRASVGEKIARAAFVVAISDFCRATLTGLARTPEDARKIVVARCGLALERFAPAPPVAADNLTLVCVGRLCPQKGQVHIPAAVAALRPRFPGLKVLLVGDGESRAAVEAEIARHGVGDEVQLLGWADNARVRALVAGSRALLLPSYAEGLPIVIMEAFALARPVISTTIAGIPELVDDSCGWLVTPGVHAELVEAMGDVLAASPEQLAAMGAAGRARVEHQHDRRRLARTLRGLFAQALGVSPAGEIAEHVPAADTLVP